MDNVELAEFNFAKEVRENHIKDNDGKDICKCLHCNVTRLIIEMIKTQNKA